MYIKNIKMNLSGKSVSLISALLLSIIIFSSGCTIKVPMSPNIGKIQIDEKLPVEAGLLITEETKNYIFKGNPESFTGSARPHEFPLGEALEKASSQAFLQVFQKVSLFRAFDEAKNSLIIIEPKIEDFHFRYDQLSYAGFAVAVLSKIKVHVTLANGETKIWEKSIESPEQKKGPWVVNMSYERDVGESASDALVYALKKIALEITEDASIKEYIALSGSFISSKERKPDSEKQKEEKSAVENQRLTEEQEKNKLAYIPQTTSQMYKKSGFKLAIFPLKLVNFRTYDSESSIRAENEYALNKAIKANNTFIPEFSYYELNKVKTKKFSDEILNKTTLDNLWIRKNTSSSFTPNVDLICNIGKKLHVDAILTYYIYVGHVNQNIDVDAFLINVNTRKIYHERSSNQNYPYNVTLEFQMATNKVYEAYEKDASP